MKYRIIGLISAAVCSLALFSSCSDGKMPEMEQVPELPDREDNISGEVYDYTVTMKPERPYMHDYDRTLMMKLFLARPDGQGGSKVGLTFADALDVIKGLDAITRGLPKIVYLVGWQYEGHDCKYPAFHEFNEALKRPEDATAQESFYWLQDEAAKYNTTVSVHVLVQDAYPNSPLWHEYVRNDFICLDATGAFITRGTFNGVPMYDINIVNEWKKGYLQDRLDDLAGLVRLDKVRTMHCDAFYARESPYHGVTVEQTEVVMRKMLRYMRDRGVDVTVEFLHNGQRSDPMIGLNPAVWWLDLTAEERAELPASLIAGGQEGKFNNLWEMETFLFGDNYHAESDFNFVDYSGNDMKSAWKKAKLGIATRTVPYMYFNRHNVEGYDAVNRTVTYSGGLVSDYGDLTVTHDGVLLRDHNNIFFPLVWITDHKEIMAYSQNGYSRRSWTLPADWNDVTAVNVRILTEEGPGTPERMEVVDRCIRLSLDANTMVSIQPAE